MLARSILLLFLLMDSAFALPGPEIMLPLAAGAVQALALTALVARSLAARLGKIPGYGLLVLATALLVGPGPAVLLALLIWAWHTRIARIFLVLFLAVLAVLSRPSQKPPPLPPPLPERLLDARLGALPDGSRAVIVHVGEEERFYEASLPESYRIRPADLSVRPDVLNAVKTGQIVLFARPWAGKEVPAGIPFQPLLSQSGSGTPSYRPTLGLLWFLILPHSRYLPQMDELSGRGAALDGWLRAVDIAQAPCVRVDGNRLLSTPTARLSVPGPVVCVAANLGAMPSASRLAKQAGAKLVYGHLYPVDRWQLSPGLALVSGGILVGLGMGLQKLWEIYAVRQLQKGYSPKRIPAGLGEAAIVVGLGWILAHTPVPIQLSPLLIPGGLGGWWNPLVLVAASIGLFLCIRQGPGLLLLGGAGVWVAGELLKGSISGIELLPAVCLSLWMGGKQLLKASGGKARGLQKLEKRFPGALIPPWRECWPGKQKTDWKGPLLVRSNAPDEQSGTGMYQSEVAEAELEPVVQKVAAAYGGSVLVMPLIPAEVGGVAAGDGWGVSIEWGKGRAGVTGGQAIQGRARLGRFSGQLERDTCISEPVDTSISDTSISDTSISEPSLRRLAELCDTSRCIEWLKTSNGLEVVQADTLIHVSALRDTLLMYHPGVVELELLDEGLLQPASLQSLNRWEQLWNQGFKKALRLCGLWWPGRAAVLVAGGKLWADREVFEGGARLLQWFCRKKAPELAARLASVKVEDPVALCAASLALRLLEPLISEEPGLPDPPLSPSERALQEGWPGWRGEAELDWESVRFGEPPVFSPLTAPVRLDRRWVAWARDELRARIVAWVARNPKVRGELAVVEPGLPSRITLAWLEKRLAKNAPGRWVSGAGPVEGVFSETPGPEQILLLQTADPKKLRPGFAAVVCLQGGELSHAALVARNLKIPALFGVGQVPKAGRVRLCAGGTVEPCG